MFRYHHHSNQYLSNEFYRRLIFCSFLTSVEFLFDESTRCEISKRFRVCREIMRDSDATVAI